MAKVNMSTALLELEPFKIQTQTTVFPGCFPIDNYTVAYATSRFIVMHCLPLKEEKLIPLPANSLLLQVVASPDGEVFATLENSIVDEASIGSINQQSPADQDVQNIIVDNQLLTVNQESVKKALQRTGKAKQKNVTNQLGIYSVSTQKRLSTIQLDELPLRLEFGRQNKIILLYYETKAIFLAWQRAQIDEVIEHQRGQIFIERSQQINGIFFDQKNKITIFRKQDGEYKQFQPTRMYYNLQIPFLGGGYLDSNTSALVTYNGDILIFKQSKFFGVVMCQKQQYNQFTQEYTITGEVTACCIKNNKVLVAANSGEIYFLAIAEQPFQKKKNVLKQIYTENEEEMIEVELDKLEKVFPSSLQAEANLYPYTILQKCQSSSSYKGASFNTFYCLFQDALDNIAVWPFVERKILKRGGIAMYEHTISEIQKREQLVQKKIEKYEPPRVEEQENALERYQQVVDAGDDTMVENALNSKDSEQADISSTNIGILLNEIVDELENPESVKFLQISEQTPSDIISDVICGVPLAEFQPQFINQQSTSARQALYDNFVLQTGFRLSNSFFVVSDIKFARFSPLTGILLLCKDEELYVVGVQDYKFLCSYKLNQQILDIQLSPTSFVFYAVYSEGIGIFCLFQNRVQLIMFKQFPGISKIQISNGGGFLLAACDSEQPIKVLLLNQRLEIVNQLLCHNEKIIYLQFLPGDSVILSASRDGAIYGHLIGTLKRVFECLIRNVLFELFFVVTGNQLLKNTINDELLIADDATAEQQYNELRLNQTEEFLICGVDSNQKYHEIINGCQVHEIQLQDVTSYCLIQQLNDNLDAPYIQQIIKENQQDEISAIEKEGMSATSSIFNKGVENGNYGSANIYTQKLDNYAEFNSHANSSERSQQFTERPIRAVLFGSKDGVISCYDYPIRGSAPIFKVKMHESAILNMFIYQNSILVSVSRDSVVYSNIRWLIPSKALFDQNIRNKSLSKLKQLFEQQAVKRSLIRLPLTRILPSFSFTCVNKQREMCQIYDKLLFQIVINMSEMWKYNDFRVNLIQQTARERRNTICKAVADLHVRLQSNLGAIQEQISQNKEQLQSQLDQYKSEHSHVYKTSSDRYTQILGALKQSNQALSQQLRSKQQSHAAALRQLRQAREQQLQGIAQQQQQLQREKQAKIDQLDEQLQRQEDHLNEELSQLAQEREQSVQIVEKASRSTLGREKQAEIALSSYQQMQERKIQQIRAQIASVRGEIALKRQEIAQLREEQARAQERQKQQLLVLRQKDAALQQQESSIFALKSGIHDLTKTQFVLSHQIQQSKAEIRPREDLVGDMRDRVGELNLKLEAMKQQWSKITQRIAQVQAQVQAQQRQLRAAQSVHTYYHNIALKIRNQLKSIIIDSDVSQYCKKTVMLTQQWRELGSTISSNKANLYANSALEDSQIKEEFVMQSDNLEQKLHALYNSLNAEDLKFVTTQTFALDENSAMLNESHRLRDENIALKGQLQKVQAMIEALRVQDLSKKYAGSHIVKELDNSKIVLQSKRAQSQLAQIEAEKFTLRGVVSQLSQLNESSAKKE